MRGIKFRGKAKASTEKLDELGMEHIISAMASVTCKRQKQR